MKWKASQKKWPRTLNHLSIWLRQVSLVKTNLQKGTCPNFFKTHLKSTLFVYFLLSFLPRYCCIWIWSTQIWFISHCSRETNGSEALMEGILVEFVYLCIYLLFLWCWGLNSEPYTCRQELCHRAAYPTPCTINCFSIFYLYIFAAHNVYIYLRG